MKTMASARLPKKMLNTLRAGDRVVVHLSHYATGDVRREPFEAVLTKVQHNANFDRHGRGSPIVHWSPRPGIDYSTRHDGTEFPLSSCDGGHVVKIVERSKDGSVFLPENALSASWRAFRLMPQHASGSCVAADPISLAQYLLSRKSLLDLPYGLDEQRLLGEWEKSGFPGLKGVFDETRRIVIHGDRGFDVNSKTAWIHVGKFRAWVIKNTTRVKRTKSVFLADMKEVNDFVGYYSRSAA